MKQEEDVRTKMILPYAEEVEVVVVDFSLGLEAVEIVTLTLKHPDSSLSH